MEIQKFQKNVIFVTPRIPKGSPKKYQPNWSSRLVRFMYIYIYERRALILRNVFLQKAEDVILQ